MTTTPTDTTTPTGFHLRALMLRLRGELAARPGVLVATTRGEAASSLAVTVPGWGRVTVAPGADGEACLHATGTASGRLRPWTLVSDPVRVTPGRGVTIGDQAVRQWVDTLMGTRRAAEGGVLA